MIGEPRGRALRLIDGAMAAAALAALALLVAEYGFLPGRATVSGLHLAGVLCAAIFGALQAAKLLVVREPRAYLRTHRLDFSLLAVLMAQAVIHLQLRGTGEFRYLAARGLASPLPAFYVAVLQVYLLLIVVLRSSRFHALLVRMRLRPVQMLAASFAGLVAAGSALLALPGAAADGRSIGLLDALFTATSAVCVTGLVVVDTGTAFSGFGHAVLGLLIQAGGLGILTLTASVALFGGYGLGRAEREALVQALQMDDPGVLRRDFGRILASTFAIEAAGAAALWLAWRGALPDPWERAAWAAFHSVSAFCNAGFALFAGNASLTAFRGDAATCLVIAGLIVLGGLGFPVLAEMAGRAARGVARLRSAAARARRAGAPAARLSRHARWVLVVTALLLAGGALGFAALEDRGALGGLPPFESALAAFFQSATLRTAGFNTIALGGLGLPAVWLCVVLMLVGGSPASTAGGMKTTTAAAIVAGLARRRRVDAGTWRRALRLGGIFLLAYGGFALALALAQGAWDRRVAFEAASALATVGLSMDYTPLVQPAGKLVLCAAMFAGRVGPFAVAAALLPIRDQDAPRGVGAILLG